MNIYTIWHDKYQYHGVQTMFSISLLSISSYQRSRFFFLLSTVLHIYTFQPLTFTHCFAHQYRVSHKIHSFEKDCRKRQKKYVINPLASSLYTNVHACQNEANYEMFRRRSDEQENDNKGENNSHLVNFSSYRNEQ